MSNPSSDPQPALPYETPEPDVNAISVGVIALKILGIYCVFQTIPIVTLLAYVPGIPGRVGSTFLQFMSFTLIYVLYGCLAFLLLYFANPLADRLFRNTARGSTASTRLAIGPYLQAVAFSVVGVWFAIEGLTSCVLFIAEYQLNSIHDNAMIFSAVFRTALGIILIFRGPGLALLWHKIRTGGTTHHDPS